MLVINSMNKFFYFIFNYAKHITEPLYNADFYEK